MGMSTHQIEVFCIQDWDDDIGSPLRIQIPREYSTRPGSGGSGDGIHGGVQGVHATAAMVD